MSSLTLEQSLIDQIQNNGYLTISTFMDQVVSHYYANNEAIGSRGDFITAPEISQMFAEILAAYVGNYWLENCNKASFNLIECGPGKGTLSSDLLRATSGINEFNNYARLMLLEASPHLIAQQSKNLHKYHPVWYTNARLLSNISNPVILIANEFLDALPIHQLIKSQGDWYERVVKYSNKFIYDIIKASPELLAYMPDDIRSNASIKEGAIFEISPARISFIKLVCELIKKNTGIALFIDYGHSSSAIGDTLQAVNKHQYASLFDELGNSDVTSHVDFSTLRTVAASQGVHVSEVIPQGEFLVKMGILHRANHLSKNANPSQVKEINSQIDRLCSSKNMGDLFKVIIISSEPIIT